MEPVEKTEPMTPTEEEISSFINQKRPAFEDRVEHLLGPASELDEIITIHPEILPVEEPQNGNKDK